MTNQTEPVAQAVQARPYLIQIHDYAPAAFDQSAVHVRNGYHFDPTMAPQFFDTNGQVAITLVLGSPSPEAVTAAAATISITTQLMEAARQREIEAAAKQMATAMRLDDDMAGIKAQIAEQEKVMRKLKDEETKKRKEQAANT
ncbi:hypothetical protein [Rugamonas aquatica]|uniref:PRTRC system protein E n=1 Tax=Rugamonas aquatica TaxID=2743357 RepID=A0A6A7MYV9_9BURK|nr:hypothetical protein [Rugamonas aquatica]MQA37848.1 hypothetical protein [Rugamonas aquatica]